VSILLTGVPSADASLQKVRSRLRAPASVPADRKRTKALRQRSRRRGSL